MKNVNLDESRMIIGGKWEINCYAPSYISGGQVVERGYNFTRYSNDKKMSNKKANDVCGSGNFSQGYKSI
ncbi:hypothetical protein L3V35_18765 [Vibrio sp. L5-1]|jgi:hypothetical protein|uniref:hypothetical protein n=1 Tax=Vibrio sp. L5-1 TaxID=2912254 RepID=UPI001F36BAE3|nr:hypothetical protein [Vibrio sp. L5-1]MCF7497056.1 hypothetical protein [Vibrio sp. L5-1]